MNVRKIFYGWWIVVFVFFALLAQMGTYYSFGVFFKPIQEELGWTRADISWAIFLQQVIHGGSYIIVGYLIDKYGPRIAIMPFAVLLFLGYAFLSQASSLWQLCLFYGVMVGMGYGIGYGPLASIVARWFHRKKGLALGIAASGVGVGTMIVPPILSQLITVFGWRVAAMLTGTFLMIVFLAVAFILKRDPHEIELTPYGIVEANPVGATANNEKRIESGSTLRQALKSGQLWILILVLGTLFFGHQMVMFHVVNYATDIGIGVTLAAGILSFIGIGSIFGRLAIGLLSDIVGVKRLLFFCLLGMAMLLSLLVKINSMPLFIVFGISFGFLYGGIVPLQAVLVNRLFGSRAIGAILGIVLFGTILTAAVGPLVAGYVYDATRSYYYAFSLGAILMGVATLLSLLLKVPLQFKSGT